MSRTKKPSMLPHPINTETEDPLLEPEKIHLQRYNPYTKEMEYLIQHKGFEIHRSIWLSRSALVGAEKLIQEFQQYWKEIKSTPVDSGFSVGQNLWLKLRGHAWWPARVVQSKKVGNNRNDYLVTFYGDNTFGFVNDYTVNDFVLEKFENADKHKKSSNLKAVQQAVTLLPEDPNQKHVVNDSISEEDTDTNNSNNTTNNNNTNNNTIEYGD